MAAFFNLLPVSITVTQFDGNGFYKTGQRILSNFVLKVDPFPLHLLSKEGLPC